MTTLEEQLVELKDRKRKLVGALQDDIRAVKQKIAHRRAIDRLRRFLSVPAELPLDFVQRFKVRGARVDEFCVNELCLETDRFEVFLNVHTEEPSWPRDCSLDGFHFEGGSLKYLGTDLANDEKLRKEWSLPPLYDERDMEHPFWERLLNAYLFSADDWKKLYEDSHRNYAVDAREGEPSEGSCFEFVVACRAVLLFLEYCRDNENLGEE